MVNKITEVRKAIALAMAGIDNALNTFDIVPDKVVLPAAVVWGPDIDYDKTFQHQSGTSSSDNFRYTVVLLTSRASARAGQEQRDSYLVPTGPTSIKKAIETNLDLQALVDYLDVSEVRDAGPRDANGVPCFASELVVEVCVTNVPDA